MVDYALLAPAWLLALPLAWWLPWWMGRRGRRLTRLFAPLAVRLPAADESVPTARSNHVEPARWLLLPVLGLLLLALAEPVRYGATLTQRPAPLDLVLLMDVSISMGLRDYRVDGEPVDRLSVAKGLLDRFVTDFGGERVGLVVVGTPSAIWAPLTADLALIRHLLGRLELTMAGRNAAIGDALALVADRFGGEDRRPAVAVLISDGSAPLGRLSPTQGAALLQAAGVTLYSIALGGIDSVAAERERGGLIFAPADLALLEEIAVQTGGRLFRAVDAGGSRRAAGLGVLRAWNDAPGRPPLGLLVFAGKAHLFFPPSADRPAVAHFLDQLPGLDLPTLGNDLAGALDLAGGLLGEIAGPRALVVLSDGDLDGPARTRSEAAVSRLRERFAVDLSVVGLGGTTATAVPDPAQGWLRVEGRPVVSRLETSWLEDLAQVGDGHYLTASVEGGIALDEVWRAPAPRIADADGVLWRELYPWALIPALLLLGLGLTGRLPHLALAMVVAGLGGTMAPVPGRAAEGAAAFAALARGDSEVARGLYRSVPGYAGRFGEGVACFRLREWPCAAEAFATAAWLADDDTQRGRAAYNLAATRYRQGDYTAGRASVP